MCYMLNLTVLTEHDVINCGNYTLKAFFLSDVLHQYENIAHQWLRWWLRLTRPAYIPLGNMSVKGLEK